ncbi:AAA family ATPase, partial [Patescibacteria group bacterium]|nr:AAA family ATPase [Patescibacteria group bacterium]
MERNDLKIPVEKLRYTCDVKDFDFKDTSEVKPLINFIGQKEAVSSLRFGLEIESTGYNIMVIGDHGSGRTSLVRRELDRLIEKSKKRDKLNLKDICYIYNFDDPDRPKVLIFDAKEGRKFQKRIKSLVKILSKKIEIVLESKEYEEAAEKIVESYNQKTKPPLDVLKKQAKENNLLLQEEEGAINILPMSLKDEGKVMSDEEFKSLSKDIKEKIKKEQRRLAVLKRVTDIIVNEENIKTGKLIDDLEIKLIKKEIEKIFSRFNYTDLEVINYLNNLKDYVLENTDLFQPKNEEHNTIMLGGMQLQLNGSNGGDDFLPFRVNLLVDNSKVDRPPVIFEEYPTLNNLFGRIDKKMDKMTYYTDQTLINPGSFLLANGGYLIIKAVDLITNPGVWKKLKQTLESGFLKIEDPLESFGYFSSISLNPDSIPIEVKVIIISDLEIYQLLA